MSKSTFYFQLSVWFHNNGDHTCSVRYFNKAVLEERRIQQEAICKSVHSKATFILG